LHEFRKVEALGSEIGDRAERTQEVYTKDALVDFGRRETVNSFVKEWVKVEEGVSAAALIQQSRISRQP
jgi:hypothetical protein